VAVLFVELGSVNPPGGTTVAVFLGVVPVGDILKVPLKSRLALLPGVRGLYRVSTPVSGSYAPSAVAKKASNKEESI
jgi:hypothetical protein